MIKNFLFLFLLFSSCKNGGVILPPSDDIIEEGIYEDYLEDFEEILLVEEIGGEKDEKIGFEELIKETYSDFDKKVEDIKYFDEIIEIFKEKFFKDIEIFEECDLFSQNCENDYGCYLLKSITKCIPQLPNAKAQDEPCSLMQECKGGYYCHLYTEKTGKCEKFCVVGAKEEKYGCKEGWNCTSLIVFPNWLGICVKPYKDCDPLKPKCEEGEGCYLQSGGKTKCVPTSKNAKNEGENCKWANECKSGLWCISDKDKIFKCFKYCSLKNEVIKCKEGKKCTKIQDFPEEIGLCI